ncbi:MAG TPA: hypothetical protein VHC18_10595 [Amycolatopsis sp.]|nr:hypothetical protein [Amycolatopsis sp.]
MHARSTTIQARPADIDGGLRHIRETVLPALENIDGFTGISCMCDRESGMCIVTTAWRSADAMLASAERVRSLRDTAAQRLGATTAQVDEWEIAVLHRDHLSADGACVRAVWTQTDPANLDHAIDTFKMVSLPAMEQTQGFCSASLMVDRATGAGVGSVAYDSMDSMTLTREQTEEMRQRITRDAHVDVLQVREFELAMAHLRVPELA